MNMTISEALLERIRNTDWFHNCGNPVSAANDFKITYVKSWKEAKTYYSDQNWSSSTLEAANTLTEFLFKYYPNEYKKWNEYSAIARDFLNEELLNKLEQLKEDYKLDLKFISTIKWATIHAIMEDVYKEATDRPTFFLKLLEIYELGNFPCGWIGKWPEGSLVVY